MSLETLLTGRAPADFTTDFDEPCRALLDAPLAPADASKPRRWPRLDAHTAYVNGLSAFTADERARVAALVRGGRA